MNQDIPTALKIEAGASSSRLDLSNLKLIDLDLEIGASTTDIHLPKGTGTTRVKVEAGAASVSLSIPPDAPARIHWEGGLSTLNIDRARFLQSGRVYETADYAAAADRLEIDIEAGVGTVTIR